LLIVSGFNVVLVDVSSKFSCQAVIINIETLSSPGHDTRDSVQPEQVKVNGLTLQVNCCVNLKSSGILEGHDESFSDVYIGVIQCRGERPGLTDLSCDALSNGLKQAAPGPCREVELCFGLLQVDRVNRGL